MSVYTVKDNESGKTITFEWKGEGIPTDNDLSDVFSQAKTIESSRSSPNEWNIPNVLGQVGGDLSKAGDWMEQKRKEWTGTNVPDTRPAPEWAGRNPNAYGLLGSARESLGMPLQALAMAGGAAGGSTLGPAGSVGGAGLGYAAANQGLSAVDQILGNKQPIGLLEAAKQAAIDIPTGAAMEAGGQSIVPAANLAAKGIKNVASEALGATTGSGPGMIEEALKGGKSFTDAMRGKVTGDEIVDNAAAALNALKAQRASVYIEKLNNISQNKTAIDISSIENKMEQLLSNYRVKQSMSGIPKNINPKIQAQIAKQLQGVPKTLDFSASAVGKAAQNDIRETVDLVNGWQDKTPIGLDALKRRLGDFYSDSSQARQFVSALESEVKNTISKNVPEYSSMTKGYSEATNLIKDIESNLMLKKNGLSGRITADQTLRRLTSSMRENFEMRRDLVNILGEKTERNLAGQIAGYSANQVMPRGLVGKLSGSSAGYFVYLHPKFWPILTASSPRVVGEFLNVFGKGMREISAVSPIVPSATKSIGITSTDKQKQKGNL